MEDYPLLLHALIVAIIYDETTSSIIYDESRFS